MLLLFIVNERILLLRNSIVHLGTKRKTEWCIIERNATFHYPRYLHHVLFRQSHPFGIYSRPLWRIISKCQPNLQMTFSSYLATSFAAVKVISWKLSTTSCRNNSYFLLPLRRFGLCLSPPLHGSLTHFSFFFRGGFYNFRYRERKCYHSGACSRIVLLEK